MRQLEWEREVERRLASRPHLIPVFDHPLKIPQRLREINPAYYVVVNVVRVLEKAQGLHYKEWTPIPPGVVPRFNAWFEVHKLTAPDWMSAGVVIPFGTLDARTIPYVLERDTELRGDEVLRELDEHNRRVEEARERDRRRNLEAMVRDIPWGKTFFGPGGGRSGDMRIKQKSGSRLYIPT